MMKIKFEGKIKIKKQGQCENSVVPLEIPD